MKDGVKVLLPARVIFVVLTVIVTWSNFPRNFVTLRLAWLIAEPDDVPGRFLVFGLFLSGFSFSLSVLLICAAGRLEMPPAKES